MSTAKWKSGASVGSRKTGSYQCPSSYQDAGSYQGAGSFQGAGSYQGTASAVPKTATK